MSEVVELIGNPRPGSRTATLAGAVTRALAPDAVPRRLELAELVAVSFGAAAVPPAPVPNALAVVKAARLLVVATPTYKGTFTGLLKVFLDQLGHRELAGVVAVPVAIAASPAHQLSVGAHLTELLVELGATVPAPALVPLESELDDPDRLAAAWAATHSATLAISR